jgi:hypothetical protein
MSDIKCAAGSNKNDPSVSACSARLKIESRITGNREIAVIKDQLTEIKVNNWDKVSCVYGSATIYLIFTKQHNGVSLNISSMPIRGERKEITISEYLLGELKRESLSNSPNAPQVDYSGVDLSRMAAQFGR